MLKIVKIHLIKFPSFSSIQRNLQMIKMMITQNVFLFPRQHHKFHPILEVIMKMPGSRIQGKLSTVDVMFFGIFKIANLIPFFLLMIQNIILMEKEQLKFFSLALEEKMISNVWYIPSFKKNLLSLVMIRQARH